MTRLYSVIVVVLLWAQLMVRHTDAQGEFCIPAEGGQGVCQEISLCSKLKDILTQVRNQNNPPQESVELLRKSICGFSVSQALVCCPREDQTNAPPATDSRNTHEELIPVSGAPYKGPENCKDGLGNFKRQHVCHPDTQKCATDGDILVFTDKFRRNPGFSVPANTVFVVRSTHMYVAKDGYCIIPKVNMYLCCRNIFGKWTGCTGPRMCEARVSPGSGHIDTGSIQCDPHLD